MLSLQTVKTTFEGFPYSVAGRNDELVILKRFQDNPLGGGIMGVELKKKLAWASVCQAKAKFLLFAARSEFPYCQVATYFVTGGIAYYFSEDAGSHRVITGRVFQGMDSFWTFYKVFLASVPEDLGSYEHPFQEELPNPKRLCFEIPKHSGGDNAASHVHAALRTLARMFNNWGNVANLANLQKFP
ncbi:g11384 [Coccomyxa elongata]